MGCLEVDGSRDSIGNGVYSSEWGIELSLCKKRGGGKVAIYCDWERGGPFLRHEKKGGLLTDLRTNPPHSSTLSFARTLVDVHTRARISSLGRGGWGTWKKNVSFP